MRIRLTTLLLLTFLFYALAHEWFWQTAGMPGYLWLTAQWIPPFLILAIGIGLGAYTRNHPSVLKPFYIMAILFACVVIIGLIIDTPEKAVETKPFYLMIFATIACIPIGVKIGSYFTSAEKLVHTVAVALACISYFSFFFTQQLATTGIIGFSWLSIGWPMRIVESFALFYFIQKLVNSKEHALFNTLCLLGPVLSTCLLFTKNIIMPVLVGLIALILANIYFAGTRHLLKNTLKIVGILAVLGLGFYGADTLAHGTYSAKISTEFWGHILRTNDLTDIDLNKVDSSRTLIYSIAWPRFWHSPLFGNGFGQTIHYTELGVNQDEDIPLHNAYLDMLISAGLCGFILCAIPLVRWFSHVSRRTYYLASQHMNIPLLAYVVMLCTYSMANSIKYFYGIMTLTVFLMSLAYGQTLIEYPQNEGKAPR